MPNELAHSGQLKPQANDMAEHSGKMSLMSFAFEHMAKALYLVGDDARFLHTNPAACHLLGYCGDAFRRQGISIAIDDSGTGYSALGYPKRFPIDGLKIDRSFICDVTLNRDSAEFVRAIITLENSLRQGLVAEGIENSEQELFLLVNDCHLGQGYRYGKPMPRHEFEAKFLSVENLGSAQ